MSGQENLQVIEKQEILRTLDDLKVFFQEYQTLMDNAWESDSLEEESGRILTEHRAMTANGNHVIVRTGMVTVLLRYLLGKIKDDNLVFHLTGQDNAVPEEKDQQFEEFSNHLRSLNDVLEQRIGRIFKLARHASGGTGQRLHLLLGPIASLFKGIVRQDWEDVDLVMNHINVVTTSRQSHELVEHIGRMVRSIYNSLKDISADYSVESFSHVSNEIPDAIDKINSVILEMENIANRNLDILEDLSGWLNEDKKKLESSISALNDCETELTALMTEDPAAGKDISEVKGILESEVRAPLETFNETLDKSHDIYMTLFANQSFQDLSGQTLKRVITFIEGLEYQLIQVIAKQGGGQDVPPPKEVGNEDTQMGADANDRLNQEKVDSLLGELGF